MKVLVLNGPNLGRLDLRDSNIYGNLDFAGLKSEIVLAGKELGFECDVRQSDSEVEIISWLHEAADTNTIEVHLSNPMSREEFRHTSVISGVANGTIAGFGPDSYRLALIALSRMAK